jgi:hypothetical protein
MLSKDCDPAKSTIGMLGRNNNVLAGDGFLVAAITYPGDNPPQGSIAILDLETGKQTGFFDGNGLALVPGSLQIHGDLLIGHISYAQPAPQNWIAIDRKTLCPVWQVPANAAVAAGNVLYCATNPEVNGKRVPQVLAIRIDRQLPPVPAPLP